MRKALSSLLNELLLGWAATENTGDFQKGLDAYNAGDYSAALNEFKGLAEQGNSEAQALLGWMYAKGEWEYRTNNQTGALSGGRSISFRECSEISAFIFST